jgi:hypothetical protein
LPGSITDLLAEFKPLFQGDESQRSPSDANTNLEMRQLFAERLTGLKICDIAVRCELALQALDSSVQQHLTPRMANDLGIDWEPTAVSWLFDNQLINSEAKSTLRQVFDQSLSEREQNWQRAVDLVMPLCDERDDLGWTFDLCGWFAEKSGDLDLARTYYSRGALALAFADQSIRFRTHWFPQGFGKFSLWRLHELSASGTDLKDDVREWLQVFQHHEERGLRARACEYWQHKGSLALQQGDSRKAFSAFYRSGWDLGLDNMSEFRECLRGLCDAAEAGGDTARATVARTHYESFLNRFG